MKTKLNMLSGFWIGVVEVPLFLGYDNVSLGDWFLTFLGDIVISSSKVSMSKILLGHFDP